MDGIVEPSDRPQPEDYNCWFEDGPRTIEQDMPCNIQLYLIYTAFHHYLYLVFSIYRYFKYKKKVGKNRHAAYRNPKSLKNKQYL